MSYTHESEQESTDTSENSRRKPISSPNLIEILRKSHSASAAQMSVLLRDLTEDQKELPVSLIVGDVTDRERSRHLVATLTEYFGSSRRAVEFMRTYADCVLAFPTAADVEDIAMELGVSASLAHDPSQLNRARQATHYGVDSKRISKIARRPAGRRCR